MGGYEHISKRNGMGGCGLDSLRIGVSGVWL